MSIGAIVIQAIRPSGSISQPDITLVMDGDAIITDVTLSNAIAGETFRDWVGRAWADTVADVGTDKVRRMVSDARLSGVSAFRQVTQRFPSGLELPIEYTTVRVGDHGRLIAVGKSLQAVSELQTRLIAAQHAMEQDYWKLREVETRYRLLFDASNEAVLLLRTEDFRVVEANPAAIRALGIARGWDFATEVAPDERAQFHATLARAREIGKAPGIVMHLGPDREPWIVRATLTNAESTTVIMLQLASVGGRPVTAERNDAPALAGLIERMPDGFTVLDPDGIVRRANRAFLDMVQVGAEGGAVGKSLQRWLALPGADLSVLLASIRKHGAVRLFTSVIRGELGAELDVEVSAAGDAAIGPSLIAVSVRDVSRRVAEPTQGQSPHIPGLNKAVTGNLPMRAAIDEVVDRVEREYIESALDQTDGNRTAAAELLGISRQSLYAKLNRFGLDVGMKKAS